MKLECDNSNWAWNWRKFKFVMKVWNWKLEDENFLGKETLKLKTLEVNESWIWRNLRAMESEMGLKVKYL